MPDPVFIWTTGNNLLLAGFLTVVFSRDDRRGLLLRPRGVSGVRAVWRESGQSPTDFIALAGFGPALVNMALAGLLGMGITSSPSAAS